MAVACPVFMCLFVLFGVWGGVQQQQQPYTYTMLSLSITLYHSLFLFHTLSLSMRPANLDCRGTGRRFLSPEGGCLFCGKMPFLGLGSSEGIIWKVSRKTEPGSVCTWSQTLGKFELGNSGGILLRTNLPHFLSASGWIASQRWQGISPSIKLGKSCLGELMEIILIKESMRLLSSCLGKLVTQLQETSTKTEVTNNSWKSAQHETTELTAGCDSSPGGAAAIPPFSSLSNRRGITAVCLKGINKI